MAIKIYISGNYFVIDDGNLPLKKGHAKNVIADNNGSDSNLFYFENVKGWNSSKGVPITEIQNEAGVGYTLAAFSEFCEEQTGNNSGGGSGEGLQGVDYKENLPDNLAAEDAGRVFIVRYASGGTTILGRTFGGNEPGMYLWNGAAYENKPLSKMTLDALDVVLKVGEYSIITQPDLRAALKELEAAISGGGSSFLTSATELTATDTHFYFIGDLPNGDWQINKESRTDTNIVEKATENNNPTITSRVLAETNYESLTYAV